MGWGSIGFESMHICFAFALQNNKDGDEVQARPVSAQRSIETHNTSHTAGHA
jgi:hypothetical protein